jgi:transcription-repair coupling factor (superfamily II helicase)
MIQRVPPHEALNGATYLAKAGNDVDVAKLERYFGVNGYARASTVSDRGEYAIRGGVIDAFPPGADEPVRLDLFGDTLESIRAFDPLSQRSTRQLKSVDLLPVSEALIDADAITRFRTGYVRRSVLSARIRSTPPSARAGGGREWSTGYRCSIAGWRRRSTTWGRARSSPWTTRRARPATSG